MTKRYLYTLASLVLAALAVAAEPAAAFGNAFGASGATAAQVITGTLYLQNPTIPFALFYMPDNTRPQAPDIIVERNGFDAPLYVAGVDSVLNLKNRDNITHRISVAHADGLHEPLVKLQPRQGRSATVSWPPNTLATLRSNRGTVAGSYIAHLPTANFLVLRFDGGNKVALTFSNNRKVITAYLLIPDMDLLTFTLTRGETKSLAITRNGVPMGSLVVSGE